MKFIQKPSARAAAALTTMTVLSFGLMACTPSSGGPANKPDGQAELELGISDDGYTLDKLIAAAKEEGPLVVSDSTGKITDMADAFTAKYGIKTTGVKQKAGEATEIAIREASASNIQTDVFILSDAPGAQHELIERGIASSWTPPDLAGSIDPEFQDPLVISTDVLVWGYNTELYPNGCPVDNLWALTDDDWTAHVVMEDPTLKSAILYWVNEMSVNHDDKMKQAYEDYFGESFASDEKTASAEWLKRLAKNKPLLVKSGSDSAESAGAPGQTEGFMGLLSTAKFRENEDSGYKLGLCTGIAPYSGIGYTKLGLIANGTKSPNAAKLFLHYAMTAEGIAPQVEDGKFSGNSDVPPAADEPSGILDVWDEVYIAERGMLDSDFDSLPEWSDFWITANHS
ncbi:ABC transporter substrate-binding protein [Microbacterium suwonense]|uniref:ABC transporter substrate-binding protein n=1 Tax=Microbacterium suwonense TaxID=683047 RepID=A0ABN6X6L1_9MICO|nr:ABC transporter substrate-binding protein [Microbacterium suwonense]BDZ40379.1 ABC transporter substrate-binding protein [Microbacterium suwonense]